MLGRPPEVIIPRYQVLGCKVGPNEVTHQGNSLGKVGAHEVTYQGNSSGKVGAPEVTHQGDSSGHVGQAA